MRFFGFDLVQFEAQMAKRQTPTTPAVNLFYALAEQLGRIERETMEGRWARHATMAERTHAWVAEMSSAGLRILAGEGERSPTVTCCMLPEGGDGPAVVKAMAARGFVIGGGYGRLKPDAFRIGHMGDHTLDELNLVLEHLTEVLA